MSRHHELATASDVPAASGECLRKLRLEARAIGVLRKIIRNVQAIAIGGSPDMVVVAVLAADDAAKQGVRVIRVSVIPACSP